MRHHWPVVSCHSYQNCTAICFLVSSRLFQDPYLSLYLHKEPTDKGQEEETEEHVTDLVVRKGKQFLPQSIPILHTPLLSQEIYNLICTLQESIPISPDGIGGVSILHFVRIPGTISTFIFVMIREQTYLVFHRSWAALTFILADSRVNGGNGGFPAS